MKKILLVLILLLIFGCTNGINQPMSAISNRAGYIRQQDYSFFNPQTGDMWVKTGNTWMDMNNGDMLFVTGNSIMDAQTGELSTILNDGSIFNLNSGTIYQKTGNTYMNMNTGELTFIVP